MQYTYADDEDGGLKKTMRVRKEKIFHLSCGKQLLVKLTLLFWTSKQRSGKINNNAIEEKWKRRNAEGCEK